MSAVWTRDFSWLKTEVVGCSGNWAQTAARTPWSPARSAISSEPEPTQWPNTWRLSRPVSPSTFATAAGQSVRAMSSIVNWVPDEGRSMPAR
jgi:hypothetical protein